MPCLGVDSHVRHSIARGNTTYVTDDDALDGQLLSMNACTRYKQKARFESLDLVPRCQTVPGGMERHPRCVSPSERWRQIAQHQLARPCRRRAHASTRPATES